MQNFSLKVCLRQSKRSQFYDHIVCPFSPKHFVILLSPLTATPCVVFTKLCCLFLRPFALLASQLQSGRIFTIPVTFQWLKPDDIKKKTKFISPTTAIVSNITVFLFTYCYTKTIFNKNTLFFLETWYLVIKISRSLNGRFFINTSS